MGCAASRKLCLPSNSQFITLQKKVEDGDTSRLPLLVSLDHVSNSIQFSRKLFRIRCIRPHRLFGKLTKSEASDAHESKGSKEDYGEGKGKVAEMLEAVGYSACTASASAAKRGCLRFPGNFGCFGFDGVLRLQVLEARDLPKTTAKGKGDPFCVICFGSQIFKTRFIWRSLTPRWDQEANILVYPSDCASNYKVILSVYDKDRISANDLLGRSKLDLVPLLDGQEHDVWETLTSKDSSIHGEIHVRIQFFPQQGVTRAFWANAFRHFCPDTSVQVTRRCLIRLFNSLGNVISEDLLNTVFSRAPLAEDGSMSVFHICHVLSTMLRDDSGLSFHLRHFRVCPICRVQVGPRSYITSDDDIFCHLARCLELHTKNAQANFVVGGFLSEEYAVKGWLWKLIQRISFGGPFKRVQKSGHIVVQDRETGELLRERIPAYMKITLRAMYSTKLGRKSVKKTKKLLSKLTVKYGRRYCHPRSKRFINKFIKKYEINMNEVLEPLESFQSFNDFFIRKLKPGARDIASPDDPRVVVSPADCRILVYAGISDATKVWIKGRNFTLDRLLGDRDLANYFAGGSIVICRLAPQDYHRFHFPVDGVVGPSTYLDGAYYTVNPLAVRDDVDVFTENKRVRTDLQSDVFGLISYISVGATLVGSVVLTSSEGSSVKKGDEHGHFAFGGSTIILLFHSNSIVFDGDLVRNSSRPLETLIKMGSRIGVALPSSTPVPPPPQINRTSSDHTHPRPQPNSLHSPKKQRSQRPPAPILVPSFPSDVSFVTRHTTPNTPQATPSTAHLHPSSSHHPEHQQPRSGVTSPSQLASLPKSPNPATATAQNSPAQRSRGPSRLSNVSEGQVPSLPLPLSLSLPPPVPLGHEPDSILDLSMDLSPSRAASDSDREPDRGNAERERERGQRRRRRSDRQEDRANSALRGPGSDSDSDSDPDSDVDEVAKAQDAGKEDVGEGAVRTASPAAPTANAVNPLPAPTRGKPSSSSSLRDLRRKSCPPAPMPTAVATAPSNDNAPCRPSDDGADADVECAADGSSSPSGSSSSDSDSRRRRHSEPRAWGSVTSPTIRSRPATTMPGLLAAPADDLALRPFRRDVVGRDVTRMGALDDLLLLRSPSLMASHSSALVVSRRDEDESMSALALPDDHDDDDEDGFWTSRTSDSELDLSRHNITRQGQRRRSVQAIREEEEDALLCRILM